jgi:uncharacterized protein involved in type VI secretion and phage assembly
MNLFGQLADSTEADGRFPGVAIAIVTNIKDPDGLGRVKVKLPWLADEIESDWCRVVTPMAGRQRGFYFLPEVNDEVLVAFEHGYPDSLYVLGALWNGEDKPPADNKDGKNNLHILKSRSGHQIVLDDSDDKPSILVVDKSGENQILIDTATNQMRIQCRGDLIIDSGGNVRITAKGKIDLDATQDIALKTKAGVTVDAASKGQITTKGPLDIKSNAKVSIDGGVQAEVKGGAVSVNGSGITEVKGAIVKIN